MAGLVERARVATGSLLTDSAFRAAALVGRLHPNARPARYGVDVVRDVAYGGESEHRLDVWRPRTPGPHPAVLYVHGGGFRILSKDTHWVMALAFARRGYVVFNVDYRLAPRHRFPAAVQDVCRAYEWVVANGARYGAEVSRLVVAGESAGANLAAVLAIAACYERPEPWARAVYATGVVPKVCVPACGVLQVSDAARFSRRRRLSTFLNDRLAEVQRAYLGGVDALALPGGTDLADPLLLFESDTLPARPLPAFFAGVGTRDPLLDDTRRLEAALMRRGVTCRASYHEGEVHAFLALVFRREARRYWRELFAFLDEQLPVT
ncbi:MAG: hypothetical protein EXR73_01865 [Myxococcales bacterium]|nr:hypothetical protein [Myxococcales bacterium]